MSTGVIPPGTRVDVPFGFGLVAYTSVGTASAGAAITTPNIDTRGANFLVATFTNAQAAGQVVFTDSSSNTWTALTRATLAGNSATQIWYCYNPTTSATHSINVPAVANNLVSCTFMAFTGANSTPFDQQNGAASASPGSITTGYDNELIVAVCADNTSGGPGIVATTYPFANIAIIAVIGGNRFAHGTSIMYQRVAGVVNTTFSTGSSPVSSIASFRPALTA